MGRRRRGRTLLGPVALTQASGGSVFWRRRVSGVTCAVERPRARGGGQDTWSAVWSEGVGDGAKVGSTTLGRGVGRGRDASEPRLR